MAGEGGKVTTFDKLKYIYLLNDCEPVICKDCSPANIVEVSVKKSAQVHHVKIILASIKYELKLKKKTIRSSRTATAVIKVNGQQKMAMENNKRKQSLLSYDDGVAVYADVERVEVKTFQHSMRNQACGLCGYDMI